MEPLVLIICGLAVAAWAVGKTASAIRTLQAQRGGPDGRGPHAPGSVDSASAAGPHGHGDCGGHGHGGDCGGGHGGW